MIDAGGPAPDFTLSDQDGNPVTLHDLRGRWALVYFYPKADTPGCTTQACGVRDHSADYEAANAVVLGVSPDPVADLREFADKYGLPFTLVSDPDHSLSEAYGVWIEKQNYGRTYMGNERTTFVIDGDGKIARVFPKVSPKTHDDVVLEALGELAAA
jgi:peroxiredoxin Q/BCP